MDYLKQRIAEFAPKTEAEFENALKQVIQEVALLGLERGRFFEKAAFYGGTALRILYGLPRFSEDLDFTLFRPDPQFDLSAYFQSLERELKAYGLQSRIEAKKKSKDSDVDSAFIKSETKIHFLKVEAPDQILRGMHKEKLTEIRFEVDTAPATNFQVESRVLLSPTSFQIISLKVPDLFAGKMHALLFRSWKRRVKGRDFFDLIWYLKHAHSLRADYLKEKMVQGGQWSVVNPLGKEEVIELFKKKLLNVDFDQARQDVMPFISRTESDREALKLWNPDFFAQIIEGLKVI
jgi:predicted nucleotidyltransferase component of viral defense system